MPDVKLDKAGRILEQGDVIVYGTLLGRCAALSIGVFLEVTDNNKLKVVRYHEYNSKLKGTSSLMYSERTAIIYKAKDAPSCYTL